MVALTQVRKVPAHPDVLDEVSELEFKRLAEPLPQYSLGRFLQTKLRNQPPTALQFRP